MSPLGRVGVAALVTLAAAGCGRAADDILPPPRDGRSGVQLTGTVDGRQVAINTGLPELNTGDCDLAEGPDRDVCFVTRDLDGRTVVIVLENPGALQEGAVLPVRAEPCGLDCDDVEGVAVVDVRLDLSRERQRARGGTVRVDAVDPGRRYAGTLDLELPDGRLSGQFDVVPRPETESS